MKGPFPCMLTCEKCGKETRVLHSKSSIKGERMTKSYCIECFEKAGLSPH